MPTQTSNRPGIAHLGWTAAIVGWSLCVVTMLWWVTSYEFSAHDEPRAAITHWPTESKMKLSSERPTLVFFMHPKCPCTRASLSELRKLLEASTLIDSELPDVIVVVSQPVDAAATWSDTDTVRDAATLPRATLFVDAGGVESGRFAVVTSGTVMLFEPAGTKLFVGGVTASRGHEGDSAGGVLLRQLLKRDASAPAASVPTFGCKLCTTPEATAGLHEVGAVCSEPLPEEAP